MNLKILMFGLVTITLLTACSSVKVPTTKQFQLSAYSKKTCKNQPRKYALHVSLPGSAAGYKTEKMLYVKKPFSLEPFADNAWVATPGTMLHPLLVESLQKSGRFKVVAMTLYAEPVEFRLDSELLKLQQNFLVKPSVLELSVKVVLTNVKKEKIFASKIIEIKEPCPADTPYGGVLAANKATVLLTAAVTDFVIKGVNQ